MFIFMKKNIFLKKQVFKIKYSGKSYKLKFFKNFIKFKFNKVNLNYFKFQGFYCLSQNKNIKIYPLSINKSKIDFLLQRIRPEDTYTNRGLQSFSKVYYKRTGRVSGYV